VLGFGWRVLEVDGHDMAAVVRTLEEATRGDGRPTAVVSSTVKGRGVSFMEGKFYWHTRILTDAEFATAMAELGEQPASESGAGAGSQLAGGPR
jgi:transketolase